MAPIHGSQPGKTVAPVLEIAPEHPARGCDRIEARRLSPPTIQTTLERHEHGTRDRRRLPLEARAARR